VAGHLGVTVFVLHSTLGLGSLSLQPARVELLALCLVALADLLPVVPSLGFIPPFLPLMVVSIVCAGSFCCSLCKYKFSFFHYKTVWITHSFLRFLVHAFCCSSAHPQLRRLLVWALKARCLWRERAIAARAAGNAKRRRQPAAAATAATTRGIVRHIAGLDIQVAGTSSCLFTFLCSEI
jgi:hypothetical protein